jgi:hypothetical protein
MCYYNQRKPVSIERILTKRTIILLFGLLLAAGASAQVLPRSGTHFTFGIPEGPDGLVDPILGPGTSVLTVNIVGEHDGRGTITSPNGYCQDFTFTADSVTTVQLDYSLMHFHDLGKTNKGILIKTDQPVNVVFHDFLPEAGEATQIYPDEALDTNYRITSWGLYDDPTEDNHSQFIITATKDSTDVTIIPSVLSLGNHPPRVPIQTRLNTGECYIVKADTFGVPYTTSLSNSTVHSSKPVSIIAGVTCGYNPLGEESCNELLDEVLPRRITDTMFYVVPLLDRLVTNTVLFTSDTLDFWVFSSNGSNIHTTNGQAQLSIIRAEQFTLTAPAQCFLLSEGSNLQVEGDPTIVSVLPQAQYIDTMLWFSPTFIDTINFQSFPFENFVSVIYPEASEAQVLLDGNPIASVSSPMLIVGTNMAAAVALIQPGIHKLTSPVPILAIASGFTQADGYTFIPGSIGPKLAEDTVAIPLGISATEAKTCRSFDVPIFSSFHRSDHITSVRLVATYDPSLLTLVSVNLGPLAQTGQWITDTRISGQIVVTGSCIQPFTDSGAIITATFSTGPAIVTTSISANMEVFGGDQVLSILEGGAKKTVAIQEIRDTMKAIISIDGGHAKVGDIDTAIVRIINAPNEQIDSLDLFVSYDHDLMNLLWADMSNSLLTGLAKVTPVSLDQNTDKIHLRLAPPLALTSPGIIARLIFETFVSDSTSASVNVRSSLMNSRPCPLDIVSDQVTSEFIGGDTCGTQMLRGLIVNQPFVINGIIPNPSNGFFTIDLDRHLFGEPLHISLLDMLGNEVWSTYHSSPDIHEKIPCTPGHVIPDGSYLVRIAGSGKTETQKIIIRN